MRPHAWLPLVLAATGLPAQHLQPGQTIERQIAGGQAHGHTFLLQTGQYAKIVVDQPGINVAIAVFGPDGKQIFKEDTDWIGYAEFAELIADAPGEYRLQVTAPDEAAPSGLYRVRYEALETANERHRRRVAGSRAQARSQDPACPDPVAALEEALENWRAAGDLFEQTRIQYWIGLAAMYAGDRKKAIESVEKAQPLARSANLPRFTAWALTAMGEVTAYFSDYRKAIEYYDQSLPMMRALGERRGEGYTLNLLGIAWMRLGEKRKAVALFEEAAEAYLDVQDHVRRGATVNNIGVVYLNLGEYQQSLEWYQKALDLRRREKSRAGEAQILSNMALVYLDTGEYQKALDALNVALDLNRSMKIRRAIAVNLNNLARVYLELGDRSRALQLLEESHGILSDIKDQWGMAHTLKNIGKIRAEQKEFRKALAILNQSLAHSSTLGEKDLQATALDFIGTCYSGLGDSRTARERFEQALAIHRSSGNKRLLEETLRNLGALHRERREYQQAWNYLDEALAVTRTVQDRHGEASTLAEMARLESDRGNLEQARELAENAIGHFESLRLRVMSPNLRARLFASARQVQELNVEVLARMHAKSPEKGFDAAALQAMERGRARSLLELLGESKVEIRAGVDADLLAKERELGRLIGEKAELQTRLLSGKPNQKEAEEVSKELSRLTGELEQVQSRIRHTSPEYAALTQPEPLDLKAIQTGVLDNDTVLLEYALGTNKSFLWAVTSKSVDLFELAPRTEIEAAAKRVRDLLTARSQSPPNETPAAFAARVQQADAAYLQAAMKASQMLLGPAAGRIKDKRLLIVSEGALQSLPFSALPEPGGDVDGKPVPLIVSREVLTAPSASALAALRQVAARRKPAEKALFVLADAVYSTNDARVALKPASLRGTADYARLRFSRDEAEEIARLAPPESTFKALDFDASRDRVLGPELSQYRIVHFAAHGLVNHEHPELSGIVLSMVDREGKPRNGYLRLYDIYNMRLSADLVVLSACQTGLGGEIRGEGLIGLTRGFLYSGAPRVLATLWAIDDRATAEAMKQLYEGLLARKERPAAALRAAQLAMWRTKRWQAPYYWAAFTLQGEWR